LLLFSSTILRNRVKLVQNFNLGVFLHHLVPLHTVIWKIKLTLV